MSFHNRGRACLGAWTASRRLERTDDPYDLYINGALANPALA